MASFEYSPLTRYVWFKYRCPECHEETESDAMAVPAANYMADNQEDSENDEEYECVCEHCGSALNVELYTGMYGGTAIMRDLEDEDLISYDSEDEDDSYSDDELDYGFYTDAHKALDAIDVLPPDTQSTLYRLLYANAIAYLEAYLSDTMKYLALKDDNSIRSFVENCQDFSERKLELRELFKRQDNIKKEILEYLNSLIYHNLPKISALYEDCLDINIGDIGKLMKAISTRHDIVHRNGKSKDGVMCSISKEDVEQVWEDVHEMIVTIDSQKVKKLVDPLLYTEDE